MSIYGLAHKLLVNPYRDLTCHFDTISQRVRLCVSVNNQTKDVIVK